MLFVFGNGGFRGLYENILARRHVRFELAQLRADHDALTKEWKHIQTDKAFTEYLIRKNLGYVKKGEVEYRFKPSTTK